MKNENVVIPGYAFDGIMLNMAVEAREAKEKKRKSREGWSNNSKFFKH